MFTKTASHAKWICLIALIAAALWWTQQGRKTLTETEQMAGTPASWPAGAAEAAGTAAGANGAAMAAGANQSAAKQAGAEAGSVEATARKVSYKLVPNLEDHDLTKYKAVEVTATGYYAGKESTGKSPGHPEYGVTFSGLKVIRDEHSLSTIAADPKVFPIGTVLYIPGYGYGVVADTGSAVKGHTIDLYFETKDQIYREWGKKTLNVFVVKTGAGKITEAMWNELKDSMEKTKQ